MRLTWIGHSCFRLDSDGSSVVIDPYRTGTVPGLTAVAEKADAVLCTHFHPDHGAKEQVTLTGNDCGMKITELKSFHDEVQGGKRGTNSIFIVEDGEVKVAHFGDIGCEPSREQMEQLKDLDAALIPVGGFFTIDAEQAACLVKALSPKVVIPMHYRMEGIGFDVISTVEEFTQRMEQVTVTGAPVYDTDQRCTGTLVLTPKNRA